MGWFGMPISREVRTIALKKYVRGKSQAVTANFTSGEFDCKGRRCGCTVTGLDSRLVRKLQVMRRLTGRPITVNSGSRCPTHNRDVGGTSGSYHLAAKGMAADRLQRSRLQR